MIFLLCACPASPELSAAPQLSDEDVEKLPFVQLEPMVVNALEDAGFAFVAKFRHHMIWAGLKTLVVTKVGPDSAAHKAGIKVGDRIIQIRDTKIRGLGIRKMIKEFKKKAENGVIRLHVQSKGSEEIREVYLKFDPGGRKKKRNS